MNKNKFAVNPPMGWNSYDYYDTTVTEADVRANAAIMAEQLKQHGWEYIVIDIEWYAYATGSKREQFQYIPFSRMEMDEYGRLLPCPERFPSAADGKGFAPLAEEIHRLGLKFGIHIMRGIPREAAHRHLPILGTTHTADEIADPSSICFWNPDMYGLRPDVSGAQEYYDSILALYASWGVDFIKCDDICRMDMPSAKKEIELLHRAIEKTGREIVLSLSPGPAKLSEAWHYETYSNMWRITDDFWDDWKLLLQMFERCEHWQYHVSEGCFPDCDMLPLGKLGKGFGQERETNFTKEEQKTMLSLWCIFRSPMMLGADLTQLDDWTLKLITNDQVLHLLQSSRNARQVRRDSQSAVWKAEDSSGTCSYLAVFHLNGTETIEVSAAEAGFESFSGKTLTELWTGEQTSGTGELLTLELPMHGVKLFRIEG